MQEIFVPAIAISRGAVAPENKEVLWEDISNMSLPFFERIKSYDSNTTQWRMVTQLPLELLNSLKKVDGDGSGLDANFLQGRTVNDIIQLVKDGSFTLPNGFIFIGNNLGRAEAKALSGDATLQSNGNLTLASSGVTAGIYNLASLTIDAKGRITNAVSYTISVDDIPELPQSKITGLVTDLSNRELIANKENSLIDTSTTKYPTVNLLKIGLDGKQDTLVSGTNIKTLNGDSLLGSGNIEIISENLATNNLNLPAATNRTFTLPADSTLDFGALMKLFGTGIVDFTSDVTVDNVQFKGGTGTQGEMSWSTDEETVKLIMDGTTLYMGQDTFVHVRNNTASIITKGTAVYATGTLGASGRITVAPMIADGTIPGRLFIGLAAEDIAIGVDGQVITFGKIRQIDTTAYNDGDVLWLSPTVSGGLTATEPTAPNLKIATAFVIHAANNGTLMVRAEQGNDLHSDQRVQVSGLTNGDVLTWDNTNQRWQNAQPALDTNFANTDLTQTTGEDREYNLNSRELTFLNSLRLKATGNQSLTQFAQNFTTSVDDTEMVNNSIAPLLDNTTADLYWKYKNNLGVVSDLFAKVDKSNVYGGARYTLIKSNGTQEYYDTLTDVRSNWVDGDTLHQFADETITYSSFVTVSGRNTMFSIPNINWNGNGFNLFLVGTLSNGNDFITFSGLNVILFNLNIFFSGTGGVNRHIIRAVINSSVFFTNVNISNLSDNTFICLNQGGVFGVNSVNNNASANIFAGDGFYYKCETDGALISASGGNYIECIFKNDGLITGNSILFKCFFDYNNAQVCNTNGSPTFYNCNFNIKGTFVGNDYIFDYASGTAKLKMFGCEIISTTTNLIFGCNSTGAGVHEIVNTNLYNQNSSIGRFHSDEIIISGCFLETKGGNGLISNSSNLNKKITNSHIKTSLNVIFSGTWDLSNCTLETTNSANYCLPNQPHKLVKLTFIGSNAPVNNNVFATSPDRLLKSIDYLGNVGHGLRSHFAKMTTTERDALTGVEKNYVLENTTDNELQVFNGTSFDGFGKLRKVTTLEMNSLVSPLSDELVFNTDLKAIYRYDATLLQWVALSAGYGIIEVKNAAGYPTYYSSLKDAVNAIGGNGVVTLHSDISVTTASEMVTIGTNDKLTINGNGYTITHTCNSPDNFHLIDSTNGTSEVYLNNVKIISNGTAAGTYVASVFGSVTNGSRLVQLSEDSIITTTNNSIKEFGTIKGGTLNCGGSSLGIACLVENANVTTKYHNGTIQNCTLTIPSGGAISSSYIINCIITADASTSVPITLKPNYKFWNNILTVTTGANNAININSGSVAKYPTINNCEIYHNGTGRGINAVYISEIHNTYVYAEGNNAIYTQQGFTTTYNEYTLNNVTMITNSTGHAAYSSLNVTPRSLHNCRAICLNAANTQPAYSINMGYSNAVLTVTDCEAIVHNNSVANFLTTGSVSGAYIYGLKMGLIGTGLSLSTTLLNTNTPDAFGNVKIG